VIFFAPFGSLFVLAAADSIGRHVGGLQGSELVGAAHSAFNAMAIGMRVAAGVALVCGGLPLERLLAAGPRGVICSLVFAGAARRPSRG
jgi:hypothetical protein